MKQRCANCGNETHFGNATPGRERLGWCADCYRYMQRNRITRPDGTVTWREERHYCRRTPCDSRLPAAREM